jgi:hypothetical protein
MNQWHRDLVSTSPMNLFKFVGGSANLTKLDLAHDCNLFCGSPDNLVSCPIWTFLNGHASQILNAISLIIISCYIVNQNSPVSPKIPPMRTDS